jgi:oligoendopeptidase F
MQKFVKDTDDLYFRTLESFADEKLGLRLGQLRRHDVMHLMRAKEFDRHFPGGRMMNNISGFMGKMGIDIRTQNNIVFDLDIRANKSPRAFCSPVRIPDEVYLVIYPRGGEDDYTAFLHELGHALHFSHIKNDLEFEFKWYGDSSVTEGFAMTFDHLTMNPVWLNNVLGLNDSTAEDYLRHKALNELIMLRRYAAKINYELKLNETAGLEDKKELYTEIFSETTGINYSHENYLLDVDPNFYCARYLRAWMFQSNLHNLLRDTNDCNWFEKPASGEFLMKMWSSGQKYNAEELMSLNGRQSLTMEPVKNEIFRFLKN